MEDDDLYPEEFNAQATQWPLASERCNRMCGYGYMCCPESEHFDLPPGYSSRQGSESPWVPPSVRSGEAPVTAGYGYQHVLVPAQASSTYHTASIGLSKSDYHTASMGPSTQYIVSPRRLKAGSSPYARAVSARDLWADPSAEQNWSGIGEHVEYKISERKLVNETLEVYKTLGMTPTAKVESVKCRRILLARKTVLCTKRFPVAKAIQEAAELKRLQHAHILRVIGTYVIGKEFSILLYPVAKYNLADCLSLIRTASSSYEDWRDIFSSMKSFIPCLSAAVQYMHSELTKHMDIKPQNVLVRRTREEGFPNFRVYLADFGISRSYERAEAVETDGRTSFTYKYAAPEVVEQSLRALPADIFSLGCVFLEICTSVCDINIDNYWINRTTKATNAVPSQFMQVCEILKEGTNEPAPYSAVVPELQTYLATAKFNIDIVQADPRATISRMISVDPTARPTADDLVKMFGKGRCCTNTTPPLETMIEDSHEEQSDLDEEEDESRWVAPEISSRWDEDSWRTEMSHNIAGMGSHPHLQAEGDI